MRYIAVALYVPVQNVVKTSASKILPENISALFMMRFYGSILNYYSRSGGFCRTRTLSFLIFPS